MLVVAVELRYNSVGTHVVNLHIQGFNVQA